MGLFVDTVLYSAEHTHTHTNTDKLGDNKPYSIEGQTLCVTASLFTSFCLFFFCLPSVMWQKGILNRAGAWWSAERGGHFTFAISRTRLMYRLPNFSINLHCYRSCYIVHVSGILVLYNEISAVVVLPYLIICCIQEMCPLSTLWYHAPSADGQRRQILTFYLWLVAR